MTLDYVVREILREVIREEVRAALRESQETLRPSVAPVEEEQNRYLSVAQAGYVASVSTKTIRRWIATGDLRGCRAGRLIRIKRSDLEAYLERPPEVGPAVTRQDITRMAVEILETEATRCGVCGHLRKMHNRDALCRVKKCDCGSWTAAQT